jgi:hypothetical protein
MAESGYQISLEVDIKALKNLEVEIDDSLLLMHRQMNR